MSDKITQNDSNEIENAIQSAFGAAGPNFYGCLGVPELGVNIEIGQTRGKRRAKVQVPGGQDIAYYVEGHGFI